MNSEASLTLAILTYCLDGADAIMFACLKGATDPHQLLNLLLEYSGQGQLNSMAKEPTCSGAAKKELDRLFAQGLVKWGRTVNRQALQAYDRSLKRWVNRLQSLPSTNSDELLVWFTVEGAQWIIGPESPYWPRQLEDLSIRNDWAPPLCLWGRGNPAALISCPKPLALVGSRGCNAYGGHTAYAIAYEAAKAGHLVVSGGAMGVDSRAHRGALSAFKEYGPERSGTTVAVFAGGLSHIGPRCNTGLFEDIIAQRGALISELCPATIPEPRRFLLRNRIIAALASTVVVACAQER